MNAVFAKLQLAQLNSLSFEQLQKKWRVISESEPPKFNRVYLESRLAYRIQELMHGGLTDDSIARIETLRKEFRTAKPRRKRVNKHLPPAGTILVRQFRGCEYQALVLEDGYEYNGKVYKTLTGIARRIGTHWSGPVFFGLASHEE